MDRTLLDRLRFLLRGLREPAPAKEAERRALAAFHRLWPDQGGAPKEPGPRRVFGFE